MSIVARGAANLGRRRLSSRRSPDSTLSGALPHNPIMKTNSPNAAEWFEIPTADIHKAIPFYNQVLGLEKDSALLAHMGLKMITHLEEEISKAAIMVYVTSSEGLAALAALMRSKMTGCASAVLLPRMKITSARSTSS